MKLLLEAALVAASDFSCLDLTSCGGSVGPRHGYRQYLAAFCTVKT